MMVKLLVPDISSGLNSRHHTNTWPKIDVSTVNHQPTSEGVTKRLWAGGDLNYFYKRKDEEVK